MKLSDLHNGESGVIVRVTGHGAFRRRIIEMGFVRGQHVMSVLNSPLNDPVKYSVMGYEVSLRRSEAAMIEILTEEEAEKAAMEETNNTRPNAVAGNDIVIVHNGSPSVTQRKNVIRIALVGNPNSGKTSLFNILSGGREHVGNYGGVTVAAKNGHFTYPVLIHSLPTPRKSATSDSIFSIINPMSLSMSYRHRTLNATYT